MKYKFYVYIIQSKKDKTIYIGQTHNLTERLHYHNNGLSIYTKSKIPWELVWYCAFPTKIQSDKFEKYLKTASGKAFIHKRLI